MQATAEILFKGKKKVDVNFATFNIHTDLPTEAGGENTAINPFQLFMTSIAACSGVFLKNYCDMHNLCSDNIDMWQHFHFDNNGNMVKTVTEVALPADFPENRKAALENVLKACKVKKHMCQNIVSEVTFR